MKWKSLRLALAGLALVAASASALAATYTPKPGETLSRLFPQDWKQVCKLNKLASCDRIAVGKALELPEGVEPKEVKSAKRAAATSMEATPRATLTVRLPGLKREQSCIKLGAQPFNPDHNLERTLQGIDAMKTLSAEKKEIAKAKVRAGHKATTNELVGRQVFKEMLYQDKKGQLIHVFEKPICDPDGQGGQPEVMDTYDLGDGIQLSIPRRCGNPSWFIRRKPDDPPPAIIPPSDDPQPTTPEPKGDPDPVKDDPEPRKTPPTDDDEPKEEPQPAKGSCLKPEGVFGQEFERKTRATYVAGDIRCIWYDDDEIQVSTGIGGTWVGWNGSESSGGSYDGNPYLVGLSNKVVSHNHGWDAALRFPAVGKFESSYRRAAYANHRGFDLAGLTFAFNNFGRKLEGKELFYETSFNLSFAKPIGSNVGQTWFNQPIGDVSGLRLDYYANVTLREYIMRVGDHGELYGQLGLNIEKPVSRSLSARLGMAFYERCVGFGVGFDHDLITHGTEPAVGYWVDPLQCGEANRVHVRGKQITVEAKKHGINFDPSSIGPASKP